MIPAIAFIGVAGMDYALLVEAKGRDVITASAIAAKSDLEKALNNLSGK